MRPVHPVAVSVPARGDHRSGHGGAVLYGGQVRPGPGVRGLQVLPPLPAGQYEGGLRRHPALPSGGGSAGRRIRPDARQRRLHQRRRRALRGLLHGPAPAGGGALLAVPPAGTIHLWGEGAVCDSPPAGGAPSAIHRGGDPFDGGDGGLLHPQLVAGPVYAGGDGPALLLLPGAGLSEIRTPADRGGWGRGVWSGPHAAPYSSF